VGFGQLVAAQCAKVAEAAGASRDEVSSAVHAARASTDAGRVITLTMATATCMSRHGVGDVEQARRDRAADQEDEPRRGLLPRKRK